jgi:hypothetical protein
MSEVVLPQVGGDVRRTEGVVSAYNNFELVKSMTLPPWLPNKKIKKTK